MWDEDNTPTPPSFLGTLLIFSSRMSVEARALWSALRAKTNSDYGSILDIFDGVNSRDLREAYEVVIVEICRKKKGVNLETISREARQVYSQMTADGCLCGLYTKTEFLCTSARYNFEAILPLLRDNHAAPNEVTFVKLLIVADATLTESERKAHAIRELLRVAYECQADMPNGLLPVLNAALVATLTDHVLFDEIISQIPMNMFSSLTSEIQEVHEGLLKFPGSRKVSMKVPGNSTRMKEVKLTRFKETAFKRAEGDCPLPTLRREIDDLVTGKDTLGDREVDILVKQCLRRNWSSVTPPLQQVLSTLQMYGICPTASLLDGGVKAYEVSKGRAVDLKNFVDTILSQPGVIISGESSALITKTLYVLEGGYDNPNHYYYQIALMFAGMDNIGRRSEEGEDNVNLHICHDHDVSRSREAYRNPTREKKKFINSHRMQTVNFNYSDLRRSSEIS
jgi:hypothetical protein